MPKCEHRYSVCQHNDPCGLPATEQIDGTWHCFSCAKQAHARIEKERIRKSRGVVVSAEGDVILPYSSDSSETSKLSCCIGTHDICNGWVDIVQTTPNKHVLHCRNCGLRIVMPVEVDTFAKMREYFGNLPALLLAKNGVYSASCGEKP